MTSPTEHPELQVVDGLLFHNGKLTLSTHSPLNKTVLEEFHDTPLGGHNGVAKTLSRLSASFFWKGM